MLFAQSLGEYGASSGVAAQFVRAVESGTQWVQLSLREDRPVWMAGAVCIVLGWWLFRRR